jgi:hypothetical protein
MSDGRDEVREQAEVLQLQQIVSMDAWTDEQEEALQDVCVDYLLLQAEQKEKHS